MKGEAGQEDMGASRKRDWASHEQSQQAGSADTVAIPSAVDAAWMRVHKFTLEWAFLMQRSGKANEIYELHPGDPRHAVLCFDDLTVLLEAANGN